MRSLVAFSLVLLSSSHALAQRDALVVARAHGRLRTALVRDGAVAGARDGAFVETRRGLVELRVERSPVPLFDCDVQPARALREPGHAERLVAIEGGASRTLLAAREPDAPPRAWDASVELVAVIGSLVFATETVYAEHCGAHGDHSARSVVFDLDAGREIDLAHDPDLAAQLPRLARRARAVLAERASANGYEVDETEEAPALTRLIPAFRSGGRFSLRAQLTGWAPYAFGDGVWGDYSVSTSLPITPPAFIAGPIAATRGARALVSDGRVIGASLLSASRSAELAGARWRDAPRPSPARGGER